MKLLLLLIYFCLVVHYVSAQPYPEDATYIFRTEQHTLHTIDSLLNEINFARANPIEYGQTHNIKLKNIINPPYTVDSVLQKEALEYITTLVGTRILRHAHSESCNMESLAYSTFSDYLINSLIEDLGVPNLGHRKHLLGYNHTDTKIGIGLVFDKEVNGWLVCIRTK